MLLIQAFQLVHLGHRIGEREATPLGSSSLWRDWCEGLGGRGRSPGERAGAAFLSGAHLPVPEVRKRRVARLQRAEPEAVHPGFDVPTIPTLDDRFDPAPRLPRRPRQAAAEEQVVLDLEPVQLARQKFEVTLDVATFWHRLARESRARSGVTEQVMVS